jgi:hypothetical protein
MDLNKTKLLIKDQFPEFYREEFPQFVEFVTKYYEYLATTNYSLMDSIKDIDNTLDEYIGVLKKNFAINIPEFGKLSDRDFLRFAKQFYTSRGSQDSYRFLFRALYGKEIEIIYPGEQVLKPSDGIWNQEVSIRVQSAPVSFVFDSGKIVELSPLDLTGKTITLQSSNGARSRVECIRVNHLTGNYFDIFINRNYSGIINLGDVFSYTETFDDKFNDETAIKILSLTGNVVPTPSKIKILQHGQGYTKGTLYTIPSDLPLRFRIKKIDETSNNKIVYTEIIQPGYALGTQFEQFYVIDSNNRNFLQGVSESYVPTITQTLFKIENYPTLIYPGLYTSSKGFLSDAIKLHDSNYYQSFSYVIRLDEQLESYKSLVKRLLHPAGMSLWAEYNISSQIDLKATISNILATLNLFVEDDVFTSDNVALLFNLSRSDSVSVDIYATDYFAESGVNAYTQEGDRLSFDIVTPKTDIVDHLDNGLLTNVGVQDYCDPTYFAEIGGNAYCRGEVIDNRILYAGIVRPVDGDQVVTVESGQLVMGGQVRVLHDGILRPVDGDSVSTFDSSVFDTIISPAGDSVSQSDDLAIVGEYVLENVSKANESGYLEFVPGVVSNQDYCDTTYFAEDYCRGGVDYIPIYDGIVAIFKDETTLEESGKIVVQSYVSQDIYASDYVDQDNDQTYAYGNEEVFRTIFSGIVNIPKDGIAISDSGKIVVQSYVSQDIYASDYVDQDNDQTYAYGNETAVTVF